MSVLEGFIASISAQAATLVVLLFWSSVDKRLGDIEKKVDEKAERDGLAPASPRERAHEACACERRR